MIHTSDLALKLAYRYSSLNMKGIIDRSLIKRPTVDSRFIEYVYTTADPDIKRWIGQPNRQTRIEVLPGFYSDDERIRNVQRELASHSEEPKHNFGYIEYPFRTRQGVYGLQQAGTSFFPKGCPNVTTGEKQRLHPSIQSVFDEMKRYTTGIDLTAVAYDRTSTVSYPSFSKDLSVKTYYIQNFKHNFLQYLKLTSSGVINYSNYIALSKSCGIHPCYVERRRYQPEAITKEKDGSIKPKLRTVMDIFGNEVVVSRSISGLSDIVTQRARFVYGLSATINYGMQPFFTFWRSYYSKTLSAVLKHNPNTMGTAIKGFPYIVSIDVSRMDDNMRQHWTDAVASLMSCVYTPEVVKSLFSVLSAPILCKNDTEGGSGCTILAEPGTSSNLYGNPSGWAGVSDVVKLCGLAMVTAMIAKTLSDRKNIRDICDELWLGNSDYVKLLSCGDDNLICFKFEHDLDDFKQNLTFWTDELKIPITYEDQATFIGYNFMKDGSEVKPILNIDNIHMKRLSSERSLRSGKSFVEYGFWEAMKLYQNHPRFEEEFARFNSACVRHLGISLMNLFRVTETPQLTSNWNYAESLFMSDPETIHYKVDKDEISSKVLDQAYLSIPYDYFDYVIKEIRPDINRSTNGSLFR
jgi:hypothetical protein